MHLTEPRAWLDVLPGVRAATALIVTALLVASACGTNETPGSTVPATLRSSPAATAAATLAPTPTSAPTPAASLLPLPEDLAGIPGPDDSSAELSPQTPSGEMEVGVARNFTLGHCGLLSPVDIDGSLWNPVGGHNGSGGPLTDNQVGDLINATQTIVVLSDENTMEMQTEHGAVIILTRNEGPRRYRLCA